MAPQRHLRECQNGLLFGQRVQRVAEFMRAVERTQQVQHGLVLFQALEHVALCRRHARFWNVCLTQQLDARRRLHSNQRPGDRQVAVQQ